MLARPLCAGELLAKSAGDGAKVVFTKGRWASDVQAQEQCVPCGGSGKVSSLLTAQQAMAAEHPADDEGQHDCQVRAVYRTHGPFPAALHAHPTPLPWPFA